MFGLRLYDSKYNWYKSEYVTCFAKKQLTEKANVTDKIPCNVKVEWSVTEKYTWKTPRLNQEA